MMKWAVADVPTWLVGCVLVVVAPGLSVVAKLAIRRRLRWPSDDSHNDVAGFLVAIIGVAYAVVVGFTIVSLYEASVTVNQQVSTEAADLLQLHVADGILGHVTAARVDADVVAYGNAVVDHWQTISEGGDAKAVQHALHDVYVTLDSYKPHTMAESDELRQAFTDLDSLSQAANARQLEAQESGTLPAVLWIGILIASAVTLGFALLFTLENELVNAMMVAGVAAVLGVNLFILVELGYPFIGSVSIGPGKFIDVIHLVASGLR